MKIKTLLTLSFACLYFSSFPVSSNQFNVVDIDIALSCGGDLETTTPQFPDIKITKRIPVGIFEDGIYSNPVSLNTDTDISDSDYFEIDYFGVPIGNFTQEYDPLGSEQVFPAPSFDLLNLRADLSSLFGSWNGILVQLGNSNIDMVDNFDSTYTLDFKFLTSQGTKQVCTGRILMELDCTTCLPPLQAPSVALTATQNTGLLTRTILRSGEPAVIISSLGISPEDYSFHWSTSQSDIVDTDGDSGTFTFDPSVLEPGYYVFTVSYKNNNTTPALQGQSDIVLKVVDSMMANEHDDDNDGISNKDDDESLDLTQIQSQPDNSSSFILSSSDGELKLGKTAFCVNKTTGITLHDLEMYGNNNCTGLVDVSDTDKHISIIGGLFDFEIHSLTLGQSVQLVIPISEQIPGNAVYRKFSNTTGWATFSLTGSDSIDSAHSVLEGVCPEFYSADYTAGLTEGDECVRLTITDGGANDADGVVNGLIVDPGGIAITNNDSSTSSGCTIVSDNSQINILDHLDWLLVLLLITWLNFIRSRYHNV